MFHVSNTSIAAMLTIGIFNLVMFEPMAILLDVAMSGAKAGQECDVRSLCQVTVKLVSLVYAGSLLGRDFV